MRFSSVIYRDAKLITNQTKLESRMIHRFFLSVTQIISIMFGYKIDKTGMYEKLNYLSFYGNCFSFVVRSGSRSAGNNEHKQMQS